MAKINTEKPMGQAEKKKMAEVKTESQNKMDMPKAPVKTEKKVDSKDVKVEKTVKEKTQKAEARVNGRSLPISTKVGVSICKFIKGKTIESAIKDLEEVSKLKKAVPMKGEYAHRKGKIMSGKFPVRAAGEMLLLIKSLQNNSNQADLENPIIATAIANKAMQPFAKGGRARKKRTHVTLVAKDKKAIKKKNKKE